MVVLIPSVPLVVSAGIVDVEEGLATVVDVTATGPVVVVGLTASEVVRALLVVPVAPLVVWTSADVDALCTVVVSTLTGCVVVPT